MKGQNLAGHKQLINRKHPIYNIIQLTLLDVFTPKKGQLTMPGQSYLFFESDTECN